MNAERWARIKPIFYAATEQPPNERASFIRSQCDGDESLAIEIESLLVAHDQAGSFIETPPSEMPALEGQQVDPVVGRLIGAYKLIGEIGRGGMGAVYLAERADGQYRKRVAIKLIKRGMDSDFIIRRFRNERQILADLDHPNIARLLDGGTTEEGLPYFMMEYIDGVPVDQYCDRQTLRTVERLQLFRTLCAAVHYAHQHRVIHRDIKVGNILVTRDGTPKLLDFGISKLLEPELSPETIDSTATALRLMTPEYASPEQIRGDAITPASDVYSLGVLLYELLTGRRPYRIKNRQPHEMARVICEEEPEKPSSAVMRTQQVPSADGKSVITLTPGSVSKSREREPKKLRKLLEGDVDSIVLMAMHKQPECRYTSVEEFSEDIHRYLEGLPPMARKRMRGYALRRLTARWQSVSAPLLIAALLLVVVTGLLVYSLRLKKGQPGSLPTVTSIAVLPFKPMGQEGGDEYLGQGIADSLITRLSNVREVIVRPTSAVLKYGGRDRNPVAAGRELRVDAALDGSIQKSGDRIRVTVQLVRVSDGTLLWAHKWDDRWTGIFEVQDSISEKMASALLLKLTSQERKLLAKRFTENHQAYEAYLKGRYFWNKRTPDDLKKAGEYFQQALEIDPTYALAYAGLADTYSYRGYAFGRIPPKEAIPIARAAAERAVQIDDALAEAHSALALIRFIDWDFAEAESEFKRSIELNPNYPSVRHFYAVYLAAVLGRFDDALGEANRGLELDPMSFPVNYIVAYLTYQAHRWDAAMHQFWKLAEIFPNSNVHGNLSDCYKQKGMEKKAAEEILQAMKIDGATASKLQAYRQTYAISGWKGISRKSVEESVVEWKRNPWHRGAYDIALGYAGLEEREQALQWLEKAYDAHSGMLIWIKTEPQLDTLHSDRRFQDLIQRVGFPQ